MKLYWGAVLILFCLSTGCKKSAGPDVSSIDIDTKIVRTETELSQVKNINGLNELINVSPEFYNIYINEVLGFKGMSQDSQVNNLELFLKDSLTMDLLNKVIQKYPDSQKIKPEIDLLFMYLKYYFPEKIEKIPNIYTFVSQFEYQVLVFEDKDGKDGIGIGLDMFLYPEIHYKMIDPDNTSFSDYITRSWNADHIAKKVADIYISDIIGEAPGHRMIDQMIHNGKALYLTKLLMPEVHDSVIIEYPIKQLKWCQDNELQMWSFFLDNKLFFESNPAKTGKYLNPSPDSPDMPADAPGRTANYIGWQIVKAFMKRYPETTIPELISMNNAQVLMEKSKYKPARK